MHVLVLGKCVNQVREDRARLRESDRERERETERKVERIISLVLKLEHLVFSLDFRAEAG